jgi:cytidine deaminase
MADEELIKAAIQARNNAYAPYSKIKVGAAIATEGGIIFSGANVENLRYGQLICAERNALFSAISAGERNIKEMVVVANYRGRFKPCRLCRSAIAEHCPQVKIKTINLNNKQELDLELKDLYEDKLSYELRSRLRIWIRKILR